MGGIIDSVFGGGGSSSSSQAANQNTVNVAVEVPIAVDTEGLQKALDALAGATSSGQASVAGALTGSAIINAAALGSIGKALQSGLSSLGEQGGRNTALIVALIGFAGVLIAARVIKVKKGIKL